MKNLLLQRQRNDEAIVTYLVCRMSVAARFLAAAQCRHQSGPHQCASVAISLFTASCRGPFQASLQHITNISAAILSYKLVPVSLQRNSRFISGLRISDFHVDKFRITLLVSNAMCWWKNSETFSAAIQLQSQLTLCCRILPSKFTADQLVKKILTFYGNRKSIAVLTTATTGLHHGLNKSKTQPPTIVLSDKFQHCPSICAQVFQMAFSLHLSNKTLYALYFSLNPNSLHKL